MMILLQLFFRYTRLGIAMQAEPSNTLIALRRRRFDDLQVDTHLVEIG